jgi:hypothetical protein
MEQTECSETSAYKIQTPGNHPEASIQHLQHGESLKSGVYVSSLSVLVLFFLDDLPKILVSTTFSIMLLYFFEMNIKETEIVCFQIQTECYLYNGKVLEHQLDCPADRTNPK